MGGWVRERPLVLMVAMASGGGVDQLTGRSSESLRGGGGTISRGIAGHAGEGVGGARRGMQRGGGGGEEHEWACKRLVRETTDRSGESEREP